MKQKGDPLYIRMFGTLSEVRLVFRISPQSIHFALV